LAHERATDYARFTRKLYPAGAERAVKGGKPDCDERSKSGQRVRLRLAWRSSGSPLPGKGQGLIVTSFAQRRAHRPRGKSSGFEAAIPLMLSVAGTPRRHALGDEGCGCQFPPP